MNARYVEALKLHFEKRAQAMRMLASGYEALADSESLAPWASETTRSLLIQGALDDARRHRQLADDAESELSKAMFDTKIRRAG